MEPQISYDKADDGGLHGWWRSSTWRRRALQLRTFSRSGESQIKRSRWQITTRAHLAFSGIDHCFYKGTTADSVDECCIKRPRMLDFKHQAVETNKPPSRLVVTQLKSFHGLSFLLRLRSCPQMFFSSVYLRLSPRFPKQLSDCCVLREGSSQDTGIGSPKSSYTQPCGEGKLSGVCSPPERRGSTLLHHHHHHHHHCWWRKKPLICKMKHDSRLTGKEY